MRGTVPTVGALWVVGVAAGVIAAAGIATQAPLLAGVVLVAAVVVVAVWRLDGWQRIFGLLLALLIMAASHYDVLASLAFYTRYMAAALLVAWTWTHDRDKAVPLTATPQPAQLLIKGLWWVCVIAAISVTWSVDRSSTALQTVALTMLTALIHGLVVRRWRDSPRIPRDMAVAFWALTVSAAASLVGGALSLPGFYGYFGDRLHGVYDNPNTMAAVCMLATALAWALYGHSRRIIYLAAGAVPLLAMLASESRTAILALAVGITLVALRRGLAAIVKAVYVAALAALVYATGVSFGLLPSVNITDAGFVERFTTTTAGGALNSRDIGWNVALRELSNAPFTGVGYGASGSLYEALMQNALFTFPSSSVHNSYLQWALETGLAGAIPFIVIVGVCLVLTFRAPLGQHRDGLAALVAAALVLQFAESPIFGTGQPYPWMFWPAVAALALAMTSSGPARRRQRDKRIIFAKP